MIKLTYFGAIISDTKNRAGTLVRFTRSSSPLIAHVQSFDPSADRFRYPADRSGARYVGLSVDLDALFQAHWIITTWCEGAVLELRGDV